MFIHEKSQTWMLEIIPILYVMGATILFSTLGYTILMLWICEKTFLSTIFLTINVLPQNESNLDTRNNLQSFCYGHDNHVLHSWIGFATKTFIDTIFLIINVYPWNESNFDTHNNLNSFHCGHYNHILHIRIHDIHALDLARKAFLSTISL